ASYRQRARVQMGIVGAIQLHLEQSQIRLLIHAEHYIWTEPKCIKMPCLTPRFTKLHQIALEDIMHFLRLIFLAYGSRLSHRKLERANGETTIRDARPNWLG